MSELIDQENSRPEDQQVYTVVGTKGSGKTVFFVAATDALQRALQKLPEKHAFTELNPSSHMYRARILESLQKGVWPDKTPFSTEIGMRLTTEESWLWIFSCKVEKILSCTDSEGSTFGRAFDFERTVCEASSDEEDAMDALEQDLLVSRGVFLVLDSIQLHQGLSMEYRQGLFKFLMFLKSSKALKKLAVIFTKSDLFKEQNFDPWVKLRDDDPACWNLMNELAAKQFKVAAVKDCICDDNGEMQPPRRYDSSLNSSGLLEPMLWMLDLKLDEVHGQ